ncbi:MAG: phage major capsid protein [Acidobacteriota bacterium]
MINLFDLKREQKAALDAAEAMLGPNGHTMTKAEEENYNTHMAKFEDLGRKIKAHERVNNIRAMFPNGQPGIGVLDAASPAVGLMHTVATPPNWADTNRPEYKSALVSFLRTGGKAHGDELIAGADGQGGYHMPGSELYTRQRLPNGSFSRNGMNAALYEGTDGSSNGAGGYAVSVPTIQQVVPLALPDLGIFDASLVLETATDIKIPVQASFGTSALKAESSGTIATFGGTDPALGQIELRSYMVGAVRVASFELLQDVQQFQQFLVDDLLKGQRILEGQLFATGTGTNQPQGVFGNTGNGTGTAYQLTGAATDGLTLLDALFDVTATLQPQYQANASWIMSRATGLAIRRAQMQSNLFVPVATVDADGTERILGRPVFYDVNAPALPTATTAGVLPILYGDFKAGNVIGARGGAGINIKILDQPLAMQGQIAILAYRRVDSRVRLTEAIQSVNVAHS